MRFDVRLAKQGKLGEAREWLERVPKEAIANDVELRIVSG
jgi:ATP/maltotriose-dependent transcriptional regulator MalT